MGRVEVNRHDGLKQNRVRVPAGFVKGHAGAGFKGKLGSCQLRILNAGYRRDYINTGVAHHYTGRKSAVYAALNRVDDFLRYTVLAGVLWRVDVLVAVSAF